MTESTEWASGADRNEADVDAAMLACQDRIDYRFNNRKLLRRCLTHSSCAATRLDCNERLEFLGDAVLGLVICEHLFQAFPDRREGQLTQQKSHLVSRSTCAAVADRLQLEELIFVGRGLRRIPESVKAATTEALIAGIYLDGGLEPARRFILWAYAPELRNCSAGEAENYKSLLQEQTQRAGNVTPSYVMVEQRGPDHAREFLVAAEVAGIRFQPAVGRSKKEAEQKAAQIALSNLNAELLDAATAGSAESSQTLTGNAMTQPPSIPTTQCSVFFRPDTDALRFLPEGPYTVDDGVVSWVGIQHGADARVGSVNLLNVATGQNQSFRLPGRPGFAFPTDRAGVFVCGVERSLGLFDTSHGQWTEFAANVDSGVENTIINDGVVHEDCLIFGCKELEFKMKKAGLYLWRGRDRQLIQLRNDQICSNGKAVVSGADGLQLIDIDSPSKQIVRYSLDLNAGSVGDPLVILDLTEEAVFPDGMIITPDGRSLIVALYDPGDPEAGAARQYGLENGKLEAVWTCPGSPRVTCPQLVRVDGSVKLLLTTAVEHMPPDQQQRHPNAGCLFLGDTDFSDIGCQPRFSLPQA